MKTRTSEQEQGFILVVVAAILIVLIGFVALGVDTGALYSARTSAQEVADAAALAGAFTFVNDPTAAQPATATNAATQVAINNSIMGKPVVATDVTVAVDVVAQKVTVTVASTQPTYFAKAIWNSSANISVTAVAEAADESTGSSCAKPWFVPNSIFSASVCGSECDASQLLIDPATKTVTAFGRSKIGTEFTIKPQNPSNALSPGNFYAVRFPGASGGADYRAEISGCANAYLRCSETYDVEPGNMVGPTNQGVNDLIGDPPRFVWVAPARYRRVSDSKIFDMSENVVVAPIWSACGSGFCPDGKVKGQLQIVGFGVFFLEGISGSDVLARLLNVSSCGPGGSGEETGGTVLSFPLRLVRS
jgi:Flp pilus assembly protein TadG